MEIIQIHYNDQDQPTAVTKIWRLTDRHFFEDLKSFKGRIKKLAETDQIGAGLDEIYKRALADHIESRKEKGEDSPFITGYETTGIFVINKDGDPIPTDPGYPYDDIGEPLPKGVYFKVRASIKKNISKEEAEAIKLDNYQILGRFAESLYPIEMALYELEKNVLKEETEKLRAEIKALEKEKERKKKAKEPKAKKPLTIILGYHNFNQLLGKPKNPGFFSQEAVTTWNQQTGLKEPEDKSLIAQGLGALFNDTQLKVWEAIVGEFSRTNYQGHEKIKLDDSLALSYPNIKSILQDGGAGKEALKAAYIGGYDGKTIEIPIIKVTQAELVTLSGFNRDSKREVVEALDYLRTKQFFFYWERLLRNEKGKPVMGENGKYKMETVRELSPYFRVREIMSKEREDGKEVVDYYEIHPSAPVIDQVTSDYGGNHYFVIPGDYRDQIKALTGKRRSSPYLFLFLIWLRMQYSRIAQGNKRSGKAGKQVIKEIEQIDKTNKKVTETEVIRDSKPKPYEITITWEAMAETLKMPESLRIKNRKRAAGIIRNLYKIAHEAGYLTGYKEEPAADTLFLNPDVLSPEKWGV
jgi:hypothetical protein